MSELQLGPYLNDTERTELEAMFALIVAAEAAYVVAANRRGVLCRGGRVENWYQHVDDAEAQGWQAALSKLSHIFGEVRSTYEYRSRKRNTNDS